MWLTRVEEGSGEEPPINWQPFALDQANSKEGPEWKAWEQPGMLLALRAGEAARRQGDEVFKVFFMNMLKARHEDRRNLEEEETVLDVAEASGLDMARFREDLADGELYEIVGASHTKAVEEHGAFGVPTFVFPNGSSTFLKSYAPPTNEEAVEMYDSLWKVMENWKYVGEMKRPQPPWPQGVFSP